MKFGAIFLNGSDGVGGSVPPPIVAVVAVVVAVVASICTQRFDILNPTRFCR